MRITKYLLILLFLLPLSGVLADEGRFQIGLNIGLTVPIGQDSFKSQVGTNLAGGLSLTYYFIPQMAFQISYDRLEFASSPISIDAYQASLLYRIYSRSRVRPFFGLGAGADTAKLILASPRTYTNFAMNAQLGAEIRLGDFSYLLGGLKYHYVTNSATAPMEAHVLEPFIGVSFALGGSKRGEVVEPYVSTDDSDGDGVKDFVDQCRNTPRGESVNEYGCALKETVQFQLNIQFPSGKAEIPKAYESELLDLAVFLKKYPSVNATVEGHTDSSGNAESNKRLSQSRADSVRNYLITQHDILPQRIDAIGYGSERPVATNSTAEGRRKNRRVVAVIQAQK